MCYSEKNHSMSANYCNNFVNQYASQIRNLIFIYITETQIPKKARDADEMLI